MQSPSTVPAHSKCSVNLCCFYFHKVDGPEKDLLQDTANSQEHRQKEAVEEAQLLPVFEPMGKGSGTYGRIAWSSGAELLTEDGGLHLALALPTEHAFISLTRPDQEIQVPATKMH